MEEKEIWKDIKGFEGLYQISNMGNVKSLSRIKRNGRGYRTVPERILKPVDDSHGYLKVNLYKDGKRKTHKVHRLVAQAFCENQMGYNEVNHIDEDKTNNCAKNLEYCSRSYNCNYGTRNEKISKPILGIDRVTGLIVEFPSIMDAERKLGVAHGSIIKCCQGKLKSCGGFYWMYKNNNDDAE